MRNKPTIRLLIVGALIALLIGGLLFGRSLLSALEKNAELSNATAVATSINSVCLTFAADESGEYPPDLSALIPDYIDFPEGLIVNEDGSPKWVYHPGQRADTHNDALLFHSVRPINGLWVRAHVGGGVTVSKDLNDPAGRRVGKGGI